jgi:hypothetical protein
MPNAPRAAALMAALLAAAPAAANERLPATLAGHAFLPAFTLIAPPADAPREAWISGRFAAGPTRVDRPYSVPGDTGPAHGNRQTGISLPFIGQPLQGFSGFSMTRHADGSIYAMIDNGFGTRRNSPDALLYFVRVAPNWQAGTIDVRQTVFLRDPDRVIPFRIVNDGTAERYLTGQDFDPESIQLIGDTVWIGEEFGPFLIRATLDGRVTGVFPTLLDGREIARLDAACQLAHLRCCDLILEALSGQGSLSERERQIPGFVVRGHSNQMIAAHRSPASSAPRSLRPQRLGPARQGQLVREPVQLLDLLPSVWPDHRWQYRSR